ncbi:MAG: CRISPR-associated protein Cas5 [Verrucomicrobia bacterium]|jgi:CRISPR-associated protein Cas5d|nr:CRISPR-associated protein Cas5 [Verrucomicrobiota bacterium]OQC66358.1 MAG: CRISPR-associated protein (Cas_Cas5) [Verrucomicrobia bacterium ADurb.Bin006]MDI9381095.1 type I-E CRISPR-associated protein Cas5/CasD [Verrucomicrobiota bacterium]NMD22344.1 CRISPR-associated protein Cas5 [Verrucomicrobiota bacterium]HOA61215.1 type I-E CRISPR-associated protein Cas5/CasD [Verrucomicrobiota bacterium]
MKSFPISLEIAGSTAMWTRPDSGDSPTSYPAPTFQAAKQIFESVVWLRSAEVIPWRVEICQPVFFHRYYTNYNGPLRKDAADSLGAETAGAHQLIATVLINVRYKLHAFVIPHRPERAVSPQAQKWLDQQINGAHAYKDRFDFRLKHGQWHHTPFLGWKEFTPSELGPVRDDTSADKSVDRISLPSFLHRTFPRGQFTGYRPCFRTEWTIREGILDYFAEAVLAAMQKGDFRHVE